MDSKTFSLKHVLCHVVVQGTKLGAMSKATL